MYRISQMLNAEKKLATVIHKTTKQGEELVLVSELKAFE